MEREREREKKRRERENDDVKMFRERATNNIHKSLTYGKSSDF